MKTITAKEKAYELISKFVGISLSQVNDLVDGIRIRLAKESALIAVEEILHCEATEPSDTDWDDCGATAQYYWPQKKVDAGKFWGDVKSELQSF
jgi:hypothetical protein